MAEISPEVWNMMLKLPGWVPPTEATLLREIAEGNAKVLWSEAHPGFGFYMVKVGNPSDEDMEDATETMLWMIERRLNRLRERRAVRMATGAPTPADIGTGDDT